ncbi:MAG: class I SAM-dependent methyltransferase [Clostridia bacterium]|nr:class I SAM-dependent methyltransferase [Clostridia bacterium]
MNEDKCAIYDDESFFNNYIDLRNAENNYNDLIEQPIVFQLLGDLTGKRVLDIGCGYGAMTIKIASKGARQVTGIDVSERMIEKGKRENPHPSITYKVLPAEELTSLEGRFDAVVSCLAIHYIEDFEKLFSDVYSLLNPDGEFIFSMEHPMYTASKVAQRWICEPNSEIATGFVTDHYGEEGLRCIEWLGKKITKYHHKVDTVFNSLISAGFSFERVIEPSPSRELIEKVPKTAHELHRPAYLIVKCKRR